MKCPYRVNTRYPSVEGENWAYQQSFNDCESDCPALVNGACARVGAAIASIAYYSAATAFQTEVLGKLDDLTTAVDGVTEAIGNIPPPT
jgi:hypothetical protein